MKYSIIIPVYNAARTLRRCLDSLVDQSFDDYVSNNNFAVIGQELARCCPDLLMFGAANTGGEEQTRITGAYREAEELNIARRIAEAMQQYLFSSLVNKVFKRETIERFHLRFENGLAIGEDQLFLFTYAMHIKSLSSVEEILYFVDISDQGSLSRKARPYLTEQLMEVNRRMYAACRAAEHSPEAARCYEAALSWVTYRSAYSSCKELLKFEYSAKQRRQEIRRICKLYRAEKVRPVGWKCRVIALPIQLSWAFMLDMLVRYKAG